MENETEKQMPKCPVCREQPMPLIMHEVNTPRGLILGLVTCTNCGHVISVLVVGMNQPEIQTPKLIMGRN
jgi:C4-type Zn-finger protein